MRFIFCICLIFLSFHLKSHSTVHVIGDSHSQEFSLIPGCKIHWMGPITMHRVGRDGLAFLNLIQLGIGENQTAVFAFGEIDARCHIGKQRDQKQLTLEEVVEHLATQYIHTILLNRFLYKHLTCIVYSVTPPTDAVYNAYYPRYGTLEDRIHISKTLNSRLASLCHQVGIYFLDVYTDYANPDGSLRAEISDGNVHIHQAFNQPIRDKLNQILIQEKKK